MRSGEETSRSQAVHVDVCVCVCFGRAYVQTDMLSVLLLLLPADSQLGVRHGL